jgi:hypothetical protein
MSLGAELEPANLDVKPLAGRSPWRRLRVGDWRVLFRPLTAPERVALARVRGREIAPGTVLVDRILNRRELERAIARLE